MSLERWTVRVLCYRASSVRRVAVVIDALLCKLLPDASQSTSFYGVCLSYRPSGFVVYRQTRGNDGVLGEETTVTAKRKQKTWVVVGTGEGYYLRPSGVLTSHFIHNGCCSSINKFTRTHLEWRADTSESGGREHHCVCWNTHNAWTVPQHEHPVHITKWAHWGVRSRELAVHRGRSRN